MVNFHRWIRFILRMFRSSGLEGERQKLCKILIGLLLWLKDVARLFRGCGYYSTFSLFSLDLLSFFNVTN